MNSSRWAIWKARKTMPRSYWTGKRAIVTGPYGFVGRHLVDTLTAQGAAVHLARRATYDLRREESVAELFSDAGPKVDCVFHLAANVGGIGANQKYPASMYADNVRMDTLMIDYAAHSGVGCFVGMGSVCAYPKLCQVPFKESDLWNGYPEETNAAYGLAKRGMLACLQAHGQQFGLNWRYALSTNLYGPGDNYGDSGHVIAHLVKKFYQACIDARTPVLWGDGSATRDFLYVTDVVSGLLTIAEYGNCDAYNLGSGQEISILNLSKIVSYACKYPGLAEWDTSKPNGQPRRVLDISKAEAIGFYPKYEIESGVYYTAEAYREAVYA